MGETDERNNVYILHKIIYITNRCCVLGHKEKESRIRGIRNSGQWGPEGERERERERTMQISEERNTKQGTEGAQTL